jgi:hypothetical protein
VNASLIKVFFVFLQDPKVEPFPQSYLQPSSCNTLFRCIRARIEACDAQAGNLYPPQASKSAQESRVEFTSIRHRSLQRRSSSSRGPQPFYDMGLRACGQLFFVLSDKSTWSLGDLPASLSSLLRLPCFSRSASTQNSEPLFSDIHWTTMENQFWNGLCIWT